MQLTSARAKPTTSTSRPKQQLVGFYFVLPALLLYGVFFLYPFIRTIYLSMTDWNGVVAPVFTGLQNYQRLLGDSQMWSSLGNNVIWVIVGTAAPIIIGLFLSVVLWSGAKGSLFFRTIYFLPVVVSPVIIGVIWSWIYNPLFGILNYSLRSVGLGNLAKGWLGEPSTALYAVLVTAIWSYIGFCVVVLYSGLQKVDGQLVDAAKIDGANAWTRFRHVIIPQISSVLTMVLVYTVIGGFNVFDLVFIMTRGGPANASEVIASYTYEKAFQENEVGYGAALSMVMTLIALVAAIITLRIRGREEVA
jgi:raffinose/stachyose/melibiose transport system permease protein